MILPKPALIRVDGYSAAVLGLTLLVFILDLASPLGFGLWTLYVFPLLLWARRASPAGTAAFVALLIGLIFLGLLFSEPGVPVDYAAASRAIGVVSGIVAAFLITHWRKVEGKLLASEERTRHLNEVLRAIRDIDHIISREQDTGSLLTEVCGVLVRTRGYLIAWVGQPETGTKRVVAVAHAGTGSEYLEHAVITWDDSPAGQGPSGTALRERRPVVFDDLAAAPRFAPWRDAVVAYGCRSIASIPLICNERLFGVLTIKADRPRAFDGEEVSLLTTLAEELAHALQGLEDRAERKRMEKLLTAAAQQWRDTFDAISDGVLLLDSDYTVLRCNKAMAELLGKPFREIVGHQCHEVVHSSSGPIAGCTLSTAKLSGQRAAQVLQMGKRWFRVSTDRLKAVDGQVVGSVCVFIDITAIQEAERAVLHRLQLEHALATVSAILLTPEAPELETALGLLGQAVDANRVYIFEQRDNGRKMDNTVEWCAPGVSAEKCNLQDLDTAACPWWMTILRQGDNILVRDVASMPPEAAAERAILEAQQIRAVVVVPLTLSSGDLLGFMGFDDTRGPRDWSADDVSMLRAAGTMFAQYYELRRAFESIRTASLETIFRLAAASEYKDEDTGTHIIRVAHYAAALAERMGLDKAAVENIRAAAPMHDIGKIGIPDRIILKPGKLDPDEWEIMKGHTTIGGRILHGSDSEVIRLGETIALTHHEKWDGSGYPRGLKGTDIPLEGRIVALADVFDALSSKRPYRPEPVFPPENVFGMIREGRGTQFDPDVVDAFFALQPGNRGGKK